jgi:hypothetical protein
MYITKQANSWYSELSAVEKTIMELAAKNQLKKQKIPFITMPTEPVEAKEKKVEEAKKLFSPKKEASIK